MTFDVFDNLADGVLIEVDDSIEIKFRAQYVKEYILTVALIKFTNSIRKLIEHWKTLACITGTRNHRSHLILQVCYLVMQFFVFCLKLIPFLFTLLELLCDNFVLVLQIKHFFFQLIDFLHEGKCIVNLVEIQIIGHVF